MKFSALTAVLAASVVVAGVAGCGNNKSSSPSPAPSSKSSSSSASSSSPTTSASPSAADYTTLLIKASDIQVPGDTFTMQQPQLNPNGKPGVAATFVNQGNTRQIGDTILVLADPSQAAGTLEATKTASLSAVSGGTAQPIDVGTGGTTIAGTSPDGAKAVTILLFTEANAVATVEFDSAANDPVPVEVITDFGQKQDAAIKAGLPGLSGGSTGGPTIKADVAAKTVEDFVSKQTGFDPTDVKCPSGVKGEVGQEFDCHFTGSDGAYTAHLKVTKIEGTDVEFDIKTQRS